MNLVVMMIMVIFTLLVKSFLCLNASTTIVKLVIIGRPYKNFQDVATTANLKFLR